MSRVVVIGAGVGGLTTAAILAKAGVDVHVLEAHIYPGGCAGTFYHQGYRFDAGATLAGGFYPGGPMDLVADAAGIKDWDTQPSNPAMVVHLPQGKSVPRWSDDRRWATREEAFGVDALSFFKWQEQRADALWDLALRNIPWPPQSAAEALALVKKGLAWTVAKPGVHLRPALLADAFRPVRARLPAEPADLSLFTDAQLLISAQATSLNTNALYGAAALDLPRRGAVHIRGGMGGISARLVQAIQEHGGRVHLRNRVTRVSKGNAHAYRIEISRKEPFEAERVIFNLTPWNIRSLLEHPHPPALQRLSVHPERGWGAFMLYLGVDGAAIPAGFPLHHQILVKDQLAEGNSIFLSINPEWEHGRAPQGKRAITISTHTALERWWRLEEEHLLEYRDERQRMQEKILRAVERLLPGIQQHIDLIMDGTPQTFAYFTGRERGWVGGFPQINLFQGMAPRLAKDLYMVGDSIFPGQSTAAVALGGLRVASSILAGAVNED